MGQEGSTWKLSPSCSEVRGDLLPKHRHLEQKQDPLWGEVGGLGVGGRGAGPWRGMRGQGPGSASSKARLG